MATTTTSGPEAATDWLDAFEAYQADWAVVSAPVLPPGWIDGFDEARRVHDDLVASGRWRSGTQSLMGVLGIRHLEVRHSTVLAWLLDPAGGHGLGTGLLKRLLPRVGLSPDDARDTVSVTTEELCRHPDGDNAGRVDIVVRGAGWILVAENKIWSGLSGHQLDLYYAAYPATCTKFAFLTPSGRPASSYDPEVRAAFVAVSWRNHVIPDLREAITDVTTDGSCPSAAIDYLSALEEEFL
jgi:PD-(D/E)XK nuclease superfamily